MRNRSLFLFVNSKLITLEFIKNCKLYKPLFDWINENVLFNIVYVELYLFQLIKSIINNLFINIQTVM